MALIGKGGNNNISSVFGNSTPKASKIPNTAPEAHVAGGAKAKYRVELPSSAKLYDLGEDEHELMTPKIRETPHGTFYEPVDIDDVEKKIKRLGFVGYANYSSTAPNAVAVFSKVKAKRI